MQPEDDLLRTKNYSRLFEPIIREEGGACTYDVLTEYQRGPIAKDNTYHNGLLVTMHQKEVPIIILFVTSVTCAVAGFPLLAEERILSPICHADNRGNVYTIHNPTPLVGINWIDNLIRPEVIHLNSFFSAHPWIMWADSSSLAFVSQAEYARGYNGHIVLSRKLLNDLRSPDSQGQNLLFTILAHEYAHLYQHNRGWWHFLMEGAKTKRALELHADYLAGFYLAQRHTRLPQYNPNIVMTRWFDLGDYSFSALEHHGTPEQRAAALTAGYLEGNDYHARLVEVARRGFEWINNRGL